MDLKQLYYYTVVADMLSFSRAAERLYISQPALSQRISALENELSVKLLVRDRRNVSLTEAGKALLNISRDITSRIDSIPQLLDQAELIDSKVSTIRLGLTVDACKVDWFRFCLSRAIKEVRKVFPLANFEINELSYTDITPARLADDFDICIAMHHSPRSPHKDISRDILYTDRLCLLMSKDHPMYNDDLTCTDILEGTDVFLIDTNAGMHYQMSRILGELNISPCIRHLSSENFSMLHVYSGLGVVVYPRRALSQYEASSDMGIFEIDSVSARLYYLSLWNKSNTNALLPIFRDMLQKICNDEM